MRFKGKYIDFMSEAACLGQVMMAHERCGEEDAEAILSNLKMEGRTLAQRFVPSGTPLALAFCCAQVTRLRLGPKR